MRKQSDKYFLAECWTKERQKKKRKFKKRDDDYKMNGFESQRIIEDMRLAQGWPLHQSLMMILHTQVAESQVEDL